jgi:hypothetical protein
MVSGLGLSENGPRYASAREEASAIHLGLIILAVPGKHAFRTNFAVHRA